MRSSKVLGSGSEGRDGLVVEGCEVVLEGKEGYFLRTRSGDVYYLMIVAKSRWPI